MTDYYRNVFITGCNRGIGLELVKQFLTLPQPPHHLFATCRSVQDESATELRHLAQENSNLHLLVLELNSNDDTKRVAVEIENILQRKEGLNLVINNAAAYSFVGLEEVTADQMMEIYRTSTVGPLMVIQALLPLLRRAGNDTNIAGRFPKAAIVNISSKPSSIGDNRTGGMYPSRACKTAINMVTKSLSIDLKEDGIIAIVINPGLVKTRATSANALLTPQESVSGMLGVISSLDETKNGMFFDYNGEVIPW